MFEILVTGGWHLILWTLFLLVVGAVSVYFELVSLVRGQFVAAFVFFLTRTVTKVLFNLNLFFIVCWILGITFVA